MRVLLLALLVSLVACDSAPLSDDAPVRAGGVSLTAGAATYDRLGTVDVVLRNDGPWTVEAGACAGLERWTGEAWVPVDRNEACILLLVGLEPGRSYEKVVRLGVPAGSYRAVDTVWRQGDDERIVVATAAFRVE